MNNKMQNNGEKVRGWVAIFISIMMLNGCFMTRMPSPQAERIDGADVIGVNAGDSFAWVIPTKTGVVLVDTGWDYDGKALKAEINNRKVHAILITHGHFDHTAGLPLFPEATVYVGPGETPLVTGEVKADSWLISAMTAFKDDPVPYTPPRLKDLKDGEVLEIDGETIQAIHVYGHTQGSMMYLWKDVLFAGDSIVGRGGYVNELPSPLYDDYDAIPNSVAKVLKYKFDRIADGHVGMHPNAYEQIKTYVEENN